MRNLKRIGAVLTAMALIFSLNLTAFAAVEDTGFSDVSADAWYADAVTYVRDNGLMSGTSTTTFDPEGTMTRAMLATTLYRAAGTPSVSGSDSFTDTADDAWYTRILSSVEYGITDLIVQTGNLIIPMAAVGISNGVIRFGLDRNSNKCAVFTTGLVVTITGAVILLVLSPLLSFLSFLSDYVWLVVLYVLMANVHSVCNQFIRTMGHIRLFALDGVLRTVLTILWNILLLAVFPLGV